MQDGTTSSYMRCCHCTPRGKAGDACHVEFKWLHRLIWLLMLMPAAQLYSLYFSPPSLWSRGWLLTSAATHGNRSCCYKPNFSAIIAQPDIFGGGKNSYSLEGNDICPWWLLHGNQVIPAQFCQINNNYHLCTTLALLRAKSENIGQSDAHKQRVAQCSPSWLRCKNTRDLMRKN